MQQKAREFKSRGILLGTNDKGPVEIEPAGMLSNTVVIGQSGSGKSFVLGRLIEEIILNKIGKVVVFDLNSDFVRFEEVNEEAWQDEGMRESLLKLDSELDKSEAFMKRWQHESENFFQANPFSQHASALKICWNNLSEKQLRQLLNLDLAKNPEDVWLLGLLKDWARVNRWSFKEWEEIANSLVNWAHKHFPVSQFDDNIARYISIAVSIPTAQRVAAAIKDVLGHKIWSDKESKLDNKLLSLLALPRFTCINIESISEISMRLLTVRYVMEQLWEIATRARRDAVSEKKGDPRTPLFLVIDEVHRLAPNKTERADAMEVIELFRRTAAEGRKYGLFLLVATQRPSKLVLLCQVY